MCRSVEWYRWTMLILVILCGGPLPIQSRYQGALSSNKTPRFAPACTYTKHIQCFETQTLFLQTCPPDSKSLSISLTSSPALLRVSQGLVHTSSLAAHVWLNSGLGTSKQEEHSNREPEENRSRTCNNGVHPGSQLLNYYIICNDTMEVLHIRQVC